MKRKGLAFLTALLPVFFLAIQAVAADIHLKWDASKGEVTGYRIYYSHTSGSYSSNNSIDVGNVTDYTIKNFSPNSAYFFVVRAYNSAGESGNSNEVSWPKVTITTSAQAVNNPDTTISFHANIQPAPTQATYKWNFGDGSGTKNVSTPDINHQFSSKGNYSVTLSVVFGNGSTIKKTVKIIVQDEKPHKPSKPTIALNQTS